MYNLFELIVLAFTLLIVLIFISNKLRKSIGNFNIQDKKASSEEKKIKCPHCG